VFRLSSSLLLGGQYDDATHADHIRVGVGRGGGEGQWRQRRRRGTRPRCRVRRRRRSLLGYSWGQMKTNFTYLAKYFPTNVTVNLLSCIFGATNPSARPAKQVQYCYSNFSSIKDNEKCPNRGGFKQKIEAIERYCGFQLPRKGDIWPDLERQLLSRIRQKTKTFLRKTIIFDNFWNYRILNAIFFPGRKEGFLPTNVYFTTFIK
jgi:hypothetical protein